CTPAKAGLFFGSYFRVRCCPTMRYNKKLGNTFQGLRGLLRRMQMKPKQHLWLVIAVLGVIFSNRASAQTTTATLLGTVTDRSGATVAGAKIAARNTQTNLTRAVESNAQGEYRIEFLPIGSYELEVTAAGFKKAVLHGIVLQVSVDARADVQMELG